MYTSGDRVVYGIHGVCDILGIEIRNVDRKKVEYYILEPISQPGTRYYIPTQNQIAVSKLRPLLSMNGLKDLLSIGLVSKDIWIAEENQRKQRYRELINNSDPQEMIGMVRLLHDRRAEQVAAGKKFHLCDENFLKEAESLLRTEFALVLGIQVNEVDDYVCKFITK